MPLCVETHHLSPAENRENPLLKTGNFHAEFREKCLTKNKRCIITLENLLEGGVWCIRVHLLSVPLDEDIIFIILCRLSLANPCASQA